MATKANTVDSIGEQTADHEEDSHPMKNGATTTKGFTINSTEQGMDSQPLQNDAISESKASQTGDHSINEQSAHVNNHPSTVPNGSTTLQTGCHGSNTHCENNHLSQPLGDHDIHDQQEDSSKSVNGADDDDDDTTRPIIVTGFGGFSSGESNLSATVMQEFYRQTSKKISILTGCPDMMKDPDNLQPIETSYKFVLTPPFDPWLKFTNARLAVHLGTNDEISGNEILFELQACNGGADFWYADGYATPCSMYRKECITGGSQYLQTSFDIPTLIEKVNERVSNTTCAGEENMKFSFKESNDAGRFLCDYLYYRSLYYATQRGNGAKNVIFIHIPPAFNLSVAAEDFAVHFASVLEQIVYCLLDMCSSDSGNKGETRPLHGSTAVENGDNEKVTNGVGNGLEEESHHACKDSLTLPQNGHHKERMLSCYGQSPPCAANHRNQQEIISRPLNQTPTVFKNAIVITGFDPILYSRIPNQSWIIVQKFCSQFQQKGGQRVIEHNSISFQLMNGPPDRPNKPITTTYDYVTKGDFDSWLRTSNALLYIHVGVDGNLNSQSGNIVSFTTVAYNGYNGYWEADKNQFYRYPGPCVENSDDDYLYTQFSEEQLRCVISRLPAEVRNAKINGTFTFQQMTDKSKCGNFLCDFLYYRSLYYAKQRNERASSDDDRKSYVIFIHIPSKLNPSNLAGAAPMALVLNLIVLALLDIVTPKL